MGETMQGIDARTVRALERMDRPIIVDGEVLPGEELDVYSSVCRPGSWEWQTDQAARMRYELERRGYEAVPDPAASWRVRWVRVPRRRRTSPPYWTPSPGSPSGSW